MKKLKLKSLLFLVTFVFSFFSLQAKENEVIIGTISKILNENNKIIICEYDTQLCRIVDVSSNIEVNKLIRDIKPSELKEGWFVEAIIDTSNRLESIKIEMHKTIICLDEIKANEKVEIKDKLENSDGILSAMINDSANQLVVNYDYHTISFSEVENSVGDKIIDCSK